MEYFRIRKEKEVFLYKCSVCIRMSDALSPILDSEVILSYLFYLFYFENLINFYQILYYSRLLEMSHQLLSISPLHLTYQLH
jgi:hypothetical protein